MKKFLLVILYFSSVCHGKITIPGPLTHESRVKQKQVIEGSIPIQNTSNEAVIVRISLADYLFNSQGESFFPSLGSHLRSNGSWIRMGDSQISIEPNTTYTFSYTL